LLLPLRNSTGNWSRSDTDRERVFADYLKKVFQPNPATNSVTLPPLTASDLASQDPVEFRPSEITKVIKEQLKTGKSPGYDLITPKMVIELLMCAVLRICVLFNVIAKIGYLPQKWKKSII